MNANSAFPSRFLKAADLDGHQPVVTIDSIDMEEIGQDRQVRPIISFVGKDKVIVCNKTNWTTLIKLFGPETDEWVGKRIKLTTAEVAFKGEMTMSLRISLENVNQTKAAARKPASADLPEEQVPHSADLATDEIPF